MSKENKIAASMRMKEYCRKRKEQRYTKKQLDLTYPQEGELENKNKYIIIMK